ncbi:hypothetical protein H8R18_08835 [Nanchangia anserum]|uniref:Uncharacterized protein n=1 Tax=Nanchangia anserum TaxID=2692125 RepID=A0A8I0KQ56_9ACTO|nr:hypothetical protein [Nanchangia anserum]MBD3689615.1 hypothetical protein [Nanchangia anserum]QOX81796.1 hypothetical protein H8R18_08835 [Nanchangia anserum]
MAPTPLNRDDNHLIHSPAIRRGARGIRRVVGTLGRLVDGGRARAVGRDSRRSRETIVADALASHSAVDRVDCELTRRFGSTTRLLVRAWIDSAAAGIDAAQLIDSGAAGVATVEQARRIQHARLAECSAPSWPQHAGVEGTGEGDSVYRARRLIDDLTRGVWQCVRDERPALDVILVAAELDRPWAVGLELIGVESLLTPAAAAARYGAAT